MYSEQGKISPNKEGESELLLSTGRKVTGRKVTFQAQGTYWAISGTGDKLLLCFCCCCCCF